VFTIPYYYLENFVVIFFVVTPNISRTGSKSFTKRAFQAHNIGPSTINHPTDDDYMACRTAVNKGLLKYVTFNLETGESGTPHLQICASANKPLTATAWQAALGGRVGNIVATKSPQDCKRLFCLFHPQRTQSRL